MSIEQGRWSDCPSHPWEPTPEQPVPPLHCPECARESVRDLDARNEIGWDGRTLEPEREQSYVLRGRTRLPKQYA